MLKFLARYRKKKSFFLADLHGISFVSQQENEVMYL